MKSFLLAVVICLTISACGQNSTYGTLSTANSSCTSNKGNDSSCIVLPLTNNAGTASITVSTNAGGNTLQFEASGDNGATWVAINGYPPNSTVAASSTTATGTWRFSVSGLTNIRARCSTLASGTTSVVIQSSATAASVGVGGGGATPAGTTADVQYNSAGALAADSGNFTYTNAGAGTGTLTVPILLVGPGTPNEGTTGTDLNRTAKFVNTGGVVQLVKCGTSDKFCFLVVKETSCGGGTGCTSGNAYVQGAFTEAETFSNTAVVGNWFKSSTGTAGQVEDTGTANTSACPSGVTCLGFAMTAGTGSQTVVRLSPVIGASGSSSAIVHSQFPAADITSAGGCTGPCVFATTDTSIGSNALGTGSTISVVAQGAVSNGTAGAASYGYRITLADTHAHTVNFDRLTNASVATALGTVPFKLTFDAVCNSTQIFGTFIQTVQNGSATVSITTSGSAAPSTFNCNDAITISVAEIVTLAASAQTQLYGLTVRANP